MSETRSNLHRIHDVDTVEEGSDHAESACDQRHDDNPDLPTKKATQTR